MKPSEFQKILIAEIASKKVFDIGSFFQRHLQEVEPKVRTPVGQIAYIPLKCSVEECISRTVEFVSLWEELQKAKLIYTATDSSKKPQFNFWSSNNPDQPRPPSADFVYNEITQDYIQKVIYPKEIALETFIKNEYMTSDELALKKQLKHYDDTIEKQNEAIKEQARSTTVAIWALVISIFSLVVSVIAPLISKSTIEKIEEPIAIKNEDAIRVRIANDSLNVFVKNDALQRNILSDSSSTKPPSGSMKVTLKRK